MLPYLETNVAVSRKIRALYKSVELLMKDVICKYDKVDDKREKKVRRKVIGWRRVANETWTG